MSCYQNFTEVKTINITLFGNVLLLTIPAKNYFDGEIVKICTAQNMPDNITADTTVSIQLGDAGPHYPAFAYGHFIYGDQIRSRRAYCMRVSTEPASFVYCSSMPLCCTAHVSPPVLPLTAENGAANKIKA